MVYVFVLIGSLLGICGILGCKMALRNRSLRKFVRCMRRRVKNAEQRGVQFADTTTERTTVRSTARQMQEVHTLVREAEKSMQQKRFDNAERLYIQALTVDPSSDLATAKLAQLYLCTERPAKAEALFVSLIEQSSTAEHHALLGQALYNQGKIAASCVHFEHAAEKDPRSPERSAELGKAYIAAGRDTEAHVYLERALDRLSRDTALMRTLAQCYERLGHSDKALDTYRKVNRMEPYDAVIKAKVEELSAVS